MLALALAALTSTPPGVHVVAPGDTLAALCRSVYGSEHYAGLIALHDGVDAEVLQIGAPVDLPPLESLAQREGIASGAAQILAARARFVAVEPRLWRATAPPSVADRQELEAAAQLLEDKAVTSSSARGQLKTGAELLRALAARGPDVNHYDLADVHGRIASVLEELVRDERKRVAAIYTRGLSAWKLESRVHATDGERTFDFRSSAPIDGVTLAFSVEAFEYADDASAQAAFDAIVARADPKTGLSSAWDVVWLAKNRVAHMAAPCAFAKANVRAIEANVASTVSAATKTLHCACGGGCATTTSP